MTTAAFNSTFFQVIKLLPNLVDYSTFPHKLHNAKPWKLSRATLDFPVCQFFVSYSFISTVLPLK